MEENNEARSFFFALRLRGLRSSVTAGEALPFLLVLMRPTRTPLGFLSPLSEQDLEIKTLIFLPFSFQMMLRNNAHLTPPAVFKEFCVIAPVK